MAFDIWEFLSVYLMGSIHTLLMQAIVLKFTREPHTLWKLLLSFLSVNTLYYASLAFFNLVSIVSMTIYVVLLIFSYFFIFRCTILKSCLLGLGQIILVFILEYPSLLIHMLLGTFAHLNDYVMLFASRMIIAVILLLILILIGKLGISTNLEYDNNDEYGKRLQYIFLVYFLFLYLLTAPNMISVELLQVIPYNYIQMYNIIIFFMFLCINAFYIRSLFTLFDVSKRLEIQQSYSEALENSYSLLSTFKHDYANMMNTMGGMIDAGDIEGLREYKKELNLEFLRINNASYVYSQLKHIPLLYGIVASKLSIAEFNNVEFRFSIPCEIKLNYCSSVDFSRIIGILLDNALEAAIQSNHKFIDLNVTQKTDTYTIMVKNACPGYVDTVSIFEKGYTTKAGHSGYGLSSVMSLIEKYHKLDYAMSLEAEYINDMFIVKFTV